MNHHQVESETQTFPQRAASNGNPTGEAGRQEEDFLTMLHAVSALLDDVTVPGGQTAPQPATLNVASKTVEPITAAPAATSAAMASMPRQTLPTESRLGGQPSAPVTYATDITSITSATDAVQVDDSLRPPWEMDEQAPPDAPPRQATPPVSQPVWTIPESLFEPTATGPAHPPNPAMPPVQEQPPAPVSPVVASPVAATAPTPELEPNAITIRGKNQGVSIEIGAGAWVDLMAVLGKRLEQAAGFFRGGHVAVDVGARPLTEPELKILCDLLKTFGMELGVLRTVAERTFQAALVLGISATHETMDGPPMAVAQRANTNEDRYSYFVYRGNLRSGQVLERRDHVVVIGDVNPGAEVVSDGDIMVWGRLRGIAHAGAHGNAKCIVAALDLDPVQLRIESIIVAAPGAHENGARRSANKSNAKRPEIARLVENRLIIEPWDEARTMGSPLLKRLRE